MVARRPLVTSFTAPPGTPPAEREARRRRRDAYWLSLSTDRDWAQIAAHASGPPAVRLENLDAPGIAVGVYEIGLEGRFSGERIGAIRGKAVLV